MLNLVLQGVCDELQENTRFVEILIIEITFYSIIRRSRVEYGYIQEREAIEYIKDGEEQQNFKFVRQNGES